MKEIELSRRLKKSYLLILSLVFASLCGSVYADKIVYTYDGAGNRYDSHRQIIYTRGSVDGEAPEMKMYQDSLSSARINIYPNPTEGDLKIDIEGVLDFESSGLTIYNMSGKVLYKTNELSESNELDITDYADGTYLLVIRIKEESTTWKIIKK